MTTSEAARIRAVQALGIMGSAPDPEFDRLARLVGHVAHATYAHVCFVDGTHQFIKALEGQELPRLTLRDESICLEAVLTQAPVIIRDFRTDPRFLCRNLYDRYGFTSYASVPVRLPSHHVVGAVAAMSRDGISLSDRQMAALEECADLAGRETLIKKPGVQPRPAGGVLTDVPKAHDALRAIMTSHIRVLRTVSDGVIVVRRDGSINFANSAAERILGRPPGALLGTSFEDEVPHAEGTDESSKSGTPVLASLADGVERLVRGALFRRAQGDPLRVGYVVTPILTDARTIGAVVVFRALNIGEFSTGVDLRNTLREVSKLKEQLAKVEAAQRSAGAVPSRPLPALASKTPVDFAHLLEAIKDERSGQLVRTSATLPDGADRMGDPSSSPISLADTTAQRHSTSLSRGLSRTERWLASEFSR